MNGSVSRCSPAVRDTPTDKGVVESTLGSLNTLFCQHVAGYTGPNPTRRGKNVQAVWTVAELQDLLDEWLIVGWANRPHDSLRDPYFPQRPISAEREVHVPGRCGRLPAANALG